MKIKKNFFLNFSSIPELTIKARKNKNIHNLDLDKLINFSDKKGFVGIEFPFFRFFKNEKSTKILSDYLENNNQKYILDCEKRLSKKELIKLIKISNKLGTNFIRVKCTNILSCERNKYTKNWNLRLLSIIKKINSLKKLLQKYDVKLAIENHQDLDSNDILFIIKKVGKRYVGVNFDIGNAFATCETPLDFFKKTKNYIINFHLKDYIILPSTKGFVLHRCPILDGDSEIKKILKIIKKLKLKIPISLELGAKTPREIKIKSKNFYKYFVNEKNLKLKKSKYITKIARNNLIKHNQVQKLIYLNEINMLNKSINNLNNLK